MKSVLAHLLSPCKHHGRTDEKNARNTCHHGENAGTAFATDIPYLTGKDRSGNFIRMMRDASTVRRRCNHDI